MKTTQLSKIKTKQKKKTKKKKKFKSQKRVVTKEAEAKLYH